MTRTAIHRAFVFIVVAACQAVADGAQALDLPAVLREVAASNPTLAARREMVAAAHHRIAPAGAWQSPMLEFGAINVPTSGRFDEDPMTMTMIGIEQRVPVFGWTGLSRASASAEAAAESADVEVASFELFARAWEAYSDAYAAAELERSARDHGAEMDGLVRAAEARYDAGRGRLDDVLRARAEQARVLADVASSESERRAAEARLSVLMGREPGPIGEPLEPPPTIDVPDDPGAWTAALAGSHPRLRELGHRVDRYRLSARSMRRMVWPDLEIRASYGFRRPIEGMEQDDMWSATVGLMLPVFAGSRERAQGDEMEAMARATEAELSAARLELAQDVVATHAATLAARRIVSLLADTVLVVQRRALEASRSTYVAGGADLWRVFEAAHSYYDEQRTLVRARQELSRSEARLLAITARADLVVIPVPAVPSRSEP